MVGSLDVMSLYPSLGIEISAIVVARAMMESDVVFKNLQWREIALYLRYNMDQDALDREELADICPQRRYDRRPHVFECSGSNLNKAVRYEPWIFPEAVANETGIKKMFCVAVGIMVRTMALHDFVIDGRVFRQEKGRSIGLDLTGVMSDIFMCEWDNMVLNKMANRGIHAVVYGRYKDDVNFVVDVEDEADAVVGEMRDRKVMERVKDIADDIHPSIQVEIDCGYNHVGRKDRLPVLDVEVWIGETEDGKLKILHSHYMKGVSRSRQVMDSRSAHGENTKRNVMINEVCRILKNCSVYLPWEEAASKVTYFVKRMEYSGYDQDFRYEVVKRAMRRHELKVEQWRKGGAMYANERDEEVRAVNKFGKKKGWYKGDGKYDGVMFVQPTKKSELKRKIQEIAKKKEQD